MVDRKRQNQKAKTIDNPSLQSKQLTQALGLGTGDGDLRLLLVVHAQLVAALEPRDDFLDAIDIHHKTAMRPPEEIGVERLEQFFQGAAVGMAFHGVSHYADDTVFDGGVADLFLVHQHESSSRADHYLAGLGLRRLLLQQADQSFQLLVRRNL